MTDLKLTGNDLDLSAFDLGLVSDAGQVAQRLQIKLRTFLGEVALNTQAGVPWFEEILGAKPQDLNRIDAIFREQILTAPEVESLEAFDLEFDAVTRRLSLSFTALTLYGPASVEALSLEV